MYEIASGIRPPGVGAKHRLDLTARAPINGIATSPSLWPTGQAQRPCLLLPRCTWSLRDPIMSEFQAVECTTKRRQRIILLEG